MERYSVVYINRTADYGQLLGSIVMTSASRFKLYHGVVLGIYTTSPNKAFTNDLLEACSMQLPDTMLVHYLGGQLGAKGAAIENLYQDLPKVPGLC